MTTDDTERRPSDRDEVVAQTPIEWDDQEPVFQALTRAFETLPDADVEHLRSSIDLEAADDLFAHTRAHESSETLQIRFDVRGYDVTVSGDGLVTVR